MAIGRWISLSGYRKFIRSVSGPCNIAPHRQNKSLCRTVVETHRKLSPKLFTSIHPQKWSTATSQFTFISSMESRIIKCYKRKIDTQAFQFEFFRSKIISRQKRSILVRPTGTATLNPSRIWHLTSTVYIHCP